MRIVGESDYFDSAMSLGSDETRIFIRPKPEFIPSKVEGEATSLKKRKKWGYSSKIENPEYEKLSDIFHNVSWKKATGKVLPDLFLRFDPKEFYKSTLLGSHGECQFHFGAIFFCGKIHRFAYVEAPLGRSVLPWGYGSKAEIFYSWDSILEFAKKFPKGEIRQRSRYFWEQGSRALVDFESIKEEFLNFFDEIEHPPIDKEVCILKTGDTIIKNPCLKNFQFQKVLDPVTAFQTLEQYLYGVLGGTEKEVINISDKDRIQQHGFDKHSFRKLPTKKR